MNTPAGLFDPSSMPSAQDAPLPFRPTPTVPDTTRKQSLWDRIQNILMPQTGLAEMLSPEQMADARRQGLLASGLSMFANARGVGGGNAPSFGQALAGGVAAGQNATQGYATQLVGGAMQGAQAQELQRMLHGRETMRAMFQPKPNETAEETRSRLAQMYAYALMNGDDPTLTAMGPAMRGVMTPEKDPTAATNAQAANAAAAALKKQQGDYNTLKAEAPAHPLAKVPFDPNTDYTAALSYTRDMAKANAGPKDNWSVAPVVGKDGTPYMVNKATGATKPLTGTVSSKGAAGAGNLPAAVAQKVGLFGDMLKSGADLLPRMKALDVALSQSAANNIASGAMEHLHIPGMAGIGQMIMNRSPEYAAYQAALTPFLIATAHALSGARISNEQIDQLRKSIEIQPGDSAALRQQKMVTLMNWMNSQGGALPGSAVTAQEDQMDPKALDLLHQYGYRGAPRAAAAAPVGAGSITVNGRTYKLPH